MDVKTYPMLFRHRNLQVSQHNMAFVGRHACHDHSFNISIDNFLNLPTIHNTIVCAISDEEDPGKPYTVGSL